MDDFHGKVDCNTLCLQAKYYTIPRRVRIVLYKSVRMVGKDFEKKDKR